MSADASASSFIFRSATDASAPSGQIITGFVDLIVHTPDRGWQIAGWARNLMAPAVPVRVAILWHGQEIAQAVASVYREDLVVPGKTDGQHAFSISISDDIAPPSSSPSAFDVIVLPDRMPLSRAGDSDVPCQMALRGAVDVVGRERIAGWVRNDGEPDTRLGVTVSVDGALTRRVLANRMRADLRDRGIGDGRYGFDVPLSPPLSADMDHMVSVVCAETGTELPGSPFHFPATRRFNETFRRHIRQTLGGLATSAQRLQAMEFLASELDALRHVQGRDDARALATAQYREAKRLGGDAGQNAASRILFIDDRAPDPTRDAGSCAILSHMLAAQALGHEISFIASGTEPTMAEVHELERFDIHCLRSPAYPTVESLFRARAGSFQAVCFHRVPNALRYLALARQYMPGARLITDVADLAHVRLERQSIVEGRPELRTLAGQERVREHMATWASHAVITHSPEEATLLARAVPTASVHVVPWSVKEKAPPLPFQERHGVAFVAHYGHAPNLDAAKWLVEEIWPLVRKKRPHTELLLIGSAMPDVIVRMDDHPGVRVLGHVADLDALLRTVRLTVAPLRFGAGIKGKVLESWAAGLPCIATPVAVEGMNLSPALSVCVASGANALASLIAGFYADEEASDAVAEAGLMYVRTRLSEERVRGAFSRALGLAVR